MKTTKSPDLRKIIIRLRERAKRKVPDSDAEDLVQEVLVVLVERIQDNQAIDSLQAYADGILRHVIYDYYQRKRDLLLPNDSPGMEQAAPSPTPEQRVVWMRHLRVIEQLAEENRIDQSLLNEHFVSGAPLREVASKLDVSPGVVNGRLYRFRQKLIKHAGNCFAWILAIITGLWDRITHAAALSRVPQTAMSSLGLLITGSLAAWMWWGPSPSALSQFSTTESHSISAASHTSQLRHLRRVEQQKAKDTIRQTLTLQWKRHTPLNAATKQQNKTQFTLLAPQAKAKAFAARPTAIKIKVTVLRSRIGHSKPSSSRSVRTTGVFRNTVAMPVVATTSTRQARADRQQARADRQQTGSAVGKRTQQTQPQARPTTPAPAARPGISATIRARTKPLTRGAGSAAPSHRSPQQAGLSQFPHTTPTPKTAAPSRLRTHTTPTKNAPTRLVFLKVDNVLSGRRPLRAVGIPAYGRALPTTKQGSSFIAKPRYSFCMVQDNRIYRCDSGLMNDISGPQNETFGCQGARCRNMIGDGPSLLLTPKGTIYIVGPRHFRMSKDNGQTWKTPAKTLTPARLLSQGSLILNQQGQLWRSSQQQWKLVHTKQPSVHEVRLHLEKGHLQIEDDTGYRLKLDWQTTTKATTAMDHLLSKQDDLKKISPTAAPEVPSLNNRPQNSTPLPPQKETPITPNP